MRAIINGQRYPDGTGKSKKEAKQSAARNALDGIKSTYNTESVSTYLSIYLSVSFIGFKYS